MGCKRLTGGTRSWAEGDDRSAAKKVQKHENRSSRHRDRSTPEGRVGVVGPKRASVDPTALQCAHWGERVNDRSIAGSVSGLGRASRQEVKLGDGRRYGCARSAPRCGGDHAAPFKAIQPPLNSVCLRPHRRGPVPVVIPGWPVERPCLVITWLHGHAGPLEVRWGERRTSGLQRIGIPPEPSGRSDVGSGDTSGRWTVKHVPRSGSDSNSIRPPCNCTIP